MARPTPLEAIKQRLQELRESRAAQLAELSRKQEEAGAQIKRAADDMHNAMEVMNLDKYEEAKHRKQLVQLSLDMYTDRKTKLEKQDIITEAERNKMLDNLLDYEEDLDTDFKTTLAGYLRELASMCKSYEDEIAAVELTLRDWQNDIRANYNGCNEALRLREYLEREAALINAEE
jgi:hypothetical protein